MRKRHPSLADLLGAHSGLICAVGAGGKKSLLYHLFSEHPGRIALTATVHTTVFPRDLGAVEIIDEDGVLPGRVLAVSRSKNVAYACPSDTEKRYAGASPATIRAIHEQGGFDATYVKADGARMRWIKAPADNEPVLVERPDTVIALLSARAIGEPLSERVAHRPERVETITGVRRGEPLTPMAVGRLLASAAGALRGVGNARVVPLINMVDDTEHEQLAIQVAHAALANTTRFDRVVLTCLRRPADPVVAVVDR